MIKMGLEKKEERALFKKRISAATERRRKKETKKSPRIKMGCKLKREESIVQKKN